MFIIWWFICFCQNGNSPLHCATSRGLVNCMKVLIEAGADPNLKNKVSILQNNKKMSL